MKIPKLGRLSGISYGVGSIMGSGILFLPSLTYQLSGANVLLSWIMATLLCIPLLMMFYDMSKHVRPEVGVKGFIELGLGKTWSAIFPTLMLSTIMIGMPSSAIIVGKFVQNYFQIEHLEYMVAVYLLGFGVIANLIGKSASERMINIVSLSFFVFSILLLFITFPKASLGYDKLIPDFDLGKTFIGITMAFWAFAGFENLSFIAHEFKNPRRDFLVSMVFSLIICGLVYLGVTANYAAIISYDKIQSVMGIYQLSQEVSPRWLSGGIIVLLSVFALKINFMSWIRGLIYMIQVSASSLALPENVGNQKNPIYLLISLFSLSLLALMIFPEFLNKGLIMVSANFLTIYVLCIISFLRTSSSIGKKILSIITLLLLASSLISSGVYLIYPVLVIAICYGVQKRKLNCPGIFCLLILFLLASPNNSIFAASNKKEFSVALIFRFQDKFNGSVGFMDKGFEFAKTVYEKEKNIKINFKKYSHSEALTSVISAATQAVQEGNQVIIGGENSDEAMAISEVIKDKNIVLITPTATNPDVTKNRPYVFRACISDTLVAQKLADFVSKKLRPESIGILNNISYPYSEYLSAEFLAKISSLNPKINVIQRKILKNQKDLSEEIKFFKEKNVTQVILLSYQSDLFRFYSQAIKEKFYPSYIGSDGWGTNESVYKRLVEEQKGPQAFTAYRNVYWNEESSTKENKNFREKFLATYHDRPNSWSAIAYDTASILFDSILKIKGPITGESIRKSLKNYHGRNLLTSSEFQFDQDNTPKKDVIIYRIDQKGIGYHGTI
ncbi:MAG: amino acid permease [Bacteriovoracaceae bacterium]|nr:amino acid permease [Bacteriovoracaceae bacterium]